MATGTINNAEYFQTGETLVLDSLCVAGWISSSGTITVVGVILPKKAKGISNISVTGNIEMYGTGGGRLGTLSNYTLTGDQMLTLTVTATSAFTVGIAVCIRFNGLTVTFS